MLTDRHGGERHGNYMHTANGQKFWPFDPKPEDVSITTIAHHLSCQGRYAGATQHPDDPDRIMYPVSEHSVYVARFVERDLDKPEFALEALLHDAPEAYLQDMIRPIKYHPAFNEAYLALEDMNMQVIARRFNLVYPFPPEIKIADEAVTAAECEQIIVRDKREEWMSGHLHDRSRVARVRIKMMLPHEARFFFLQEFRRLVAVRDQFRPFPADARC